MFTWPVRVYYEDTDAGGVVYHANYLAYMERARTEWFRAAGFEQDTLIERDNTLFVVVHADVTFRRPARFNDYLHVSAAIAEHRHTDVHFVHEIRRDAVDGELLCTGRIRAACLHADSFRPRVMPDHLMERLA